jgi:hypothetical protein
MATVTVSLTFNTTTETIRPRLERIMDGFTAAVPQEDRRYTNVSIHDPADVVVCLQQQADGRVRVWHDQATDPLRVAQDEATRLRDRNAYLENALKRADDLDRYRANTTGDGFEGPR